MPIASLLLAVFLGFLAVGIPLPALPLFVRDTLGFSPLLVGCVVSAQSAVTLLTRSRAGRACDHGGARRATILGLLACACSGSCCLLAACAWLAPAMALLLLFASRALLGVGESLLVTGALAWGVNVVGPGRTGQVMAWTGIAMYAALAAGAPLGALLWRTGGGVALGLAAGAFPLAGLACLALVSPPGPVARAVTRDSSSALVPTLRGSWRPGLALLLGTVAFGGLTSFLPLRYAERGWDGTGVAFAVFGSAYVLTRLVLGRWPDRGDARAVAACSLVVEVVGQTVLWRAPSPSVAVLGAGLTGCGCSLVLPSLGVLAMAHASERQRGRALGTFLAFFDGALALTGPVSGVLVRQTGSSAAVSLLGAASAAAALLLTLSSPRKKTP